MLDSQIVEQLATVFEKLQGAVELVYAQSSHEKQAELVEMLEQVAATSSHVASRQSDKSSATPFFEIFHNSEKTGIAFSGIPGGHEFTSLILAVLNADRQGKLPDEGIIRRVQNLQGPINLRTFVSLSCENCPEVVQSLNVMTVLHSDFTHEMVDGAFFQDEIEALGIQGVPSVVDGEDLISSGKTDFAELLTTLEEHFGIDSEAKTEPVDLGTFDVAVVGGGPAGSSAAIYAARKGLQTVLVAEKIGGQVKETKGIENLISVPYTEGPELAGKLAQHLAEYDIKTLEHRRLDTIALGDMKQLELNSGEFLQAKSVIVATGAKWRTLNIPGEKEYIGRGVAFCPHCDGPFY
ncbi:MAG: alkyl hydroperoxide reductase subunit F, partial [Deltaproteobacteria bacterium]